MDLREAAEIEVEFPPISAASPRLVFVLFVSSCTTILYLGNLSEISGRTETKSGSWPPLQHHNIYKEESLKQQHKLRQRQLGFSATSAEMNTDSRRLSRDDYFCKASSAKIALAENMQPHKNQTLQIFVSHAIVHAKILFHHLLVVHVKDLGEPSRELGSK